MAIPLSSKPRTKAPDGDFIYGDIKDSTPSTPGTPVNTLTNGDFHQFFAKMSDIAGIALNGLRDCAYSGFQYFQALLGLGFKYYTDPIILGLLGGYTQGDVVILNGVVVTLSNSNNTATWTKGDIYYCPDTTKPGKVYKVAAGTTTKSSGTFLFTITDYEDCLIQISHGTSGTGIADYNASTVRSLGWSNKLGFNTFNSGWTSEFGSIHYSVNGFGLKKVWGFVTLGTFSTTVIGVLPSACFVSGSGGGEGVTHTERCRITSGGSGCLDISVNHIGQLFIDCDSSNNGQHFNFSLTYY